MSGIRNKAINSTVSYLDSVVKVGFAEPVDGLVFRMLINFVDKKVFSKMSEEDCDTLSTAMENIFDDDIVTIDELEDEAGNISNILSAYIETPMVDNTPEENAIIEGILLVIISSVDAIIEKFKKKDAVK